MTRISHEEAQPSDEQRGLYRKYEVRRLHDPAGKHAGCTYFVIDEQHDEFAGVALRAYADACEGKFPELARDLRQRHCETCGGDGLGALVGPCPDCVGKSAAPEPQPPAAANSDVFLSRDPRDGQLYYRTAEDWKKLGVTRCEGSQPPDASRRDEFFRLASAMGKPAVSLLAGSPGAAEPTPPDSVDQLRAGIWSQFTDTFCAGEHAWVQKKHDEAISRLFTAVALLSKWCEQLERKGKR